jgi:predicted anti-sigma-YlaC factor YlaD
MVGEEKREVCQQTRMLFDDAAEIQDASITTHLEDCPECKRWAQLTKEIISVGSKLPSFDVPEAVTQNILAKVTVSQRSDNQKQRWAAPILSVTAVLCLWLFIWAETPEGLCSWIVCGSILVAFKIIADTITDARSLTINVPK